MRGSARIVYLVAVLSFAFLIVPPVSADREAFDGAVNFSLSLPRLYSAVNRSPDRVIGQTVLLDGIVASITHYGSDETDFLVLVELVTADWQGLEAINLYRAYVLFGPDFMDEFPLRPSREPGPREVPANARILIAGEVTQAAGEDDGTTTPVVEAFRLRRIE
ncbi:MAG: hypothetical protein ACOCW6_05300 [Spirochaetota bacterium]